MLPLLLFCAAGLTRARLRGIIPPAGLLAIITLAGLAFAAVLAGLLTFGFRANRYVADFQPALVLAVALTGAYLCTQPALAVGWRGRFQRGLFGAGALLLALFNFLVGIQWMEHLANTRPVVYRPLAYYGNYPSYWLHLHGLMPYGPLRFEARFQTPPRPVREPLLAAGTNGYTDVLYAAQHPDGRVQFTIDHSNSGGLKSAFMPVTPGRTYVVEAELGSFYPPRLHPYFDGCAESYISRRKTGARVLVDGVPVIDGTQAFNDARPGAIEFGRNPHNRDLVFSGTISGVRRLTPPPAQPASEFGLWCLEVEFPTNALNIGQPLLASGVSGKGNLLLVESLSADSIRFGLDQWGGGISDSPPLTVDFARPHRLEVLVGPQIIRQSLPPGWGLLTADIVPIASRLQVWLDRRLVWQTEILWHRQSYNQVIHGGNTQGFSTANRIFGGLIRRVPLSDEDKRDLLLRGLEAATSPPP